ncbi:hypothetical protein ACVBGC_01925 [Burkholderia stagnalis]
MGDGWHAVPRHAAHFCEVTTRVIPVFQHRAVFVRSRLDRYAHRRASLHDPRQRRMEVVVLVDAQRRRRAFDDPFLVSEMT